MYHNSSCNKKMNMVSQEALKINIVAAVIKQALIGNGLPRWPGAPTRLQLGLSQGLTDAQQLSKHFTFFSLFYAGRKLRFVFLCSSGTILEKLLYITTCSKGIFHWDGQGTSSHQEHTIRHESACYLIIFISDVPFFLSYVCHCAFIGWIAVI